MFTRPVVFIIGAGASVDYGLPLGGALATKIAADVNFALERSALASGDPSLYELLSATRDCLKYVAAGRRLAAVLSSSVSVDDALYQLNEFPEAVELGKICIIRSILLAENRSSLQLWPGTGRMRADAGRDGWIEQLFSMAIANHRFSEFMCQQLNTYRCRPPHCKHPLGAAGGEE
jgi:hypothetical protein